MLLAMWMKIAGKTIVVKTMLAFIVSAVPKIPIALLVAVVMTACARFVAEGNAVLRANAHLLQVIPHVICV